MKGPLQDYHAILGKGKKPKFKSAALYQKIKKAEQILKDCTLCERRCRINRTNGELGYCQVDDHIRISSMFAHLGEEDFLIPSFTVFFWSCTFSCQFCFNWTIAQRLEEPIILTPKEVASAIDNSHCKNVNFVGGDPVPYLPMILKILKHVKSDIPVVWNSNFYMTEESMDLLSGVVDLYLSDWKYYSNICAGRLSKVKNYLKVIKRNHLLAFDDAELAIRHLVMPNHFACCTRRIIDFITSQFKGGIEFNLMDQYRPEFRSDNHADINRPLSAREFQLALSYAKKRKII